MAQTVDRESGLDGVQVLLVEDHPVVREVISRLLAEYGAEVTATAGVAEALIAFERRRPDVVLSDIEMPDADGYMLIRALRALPRDRGGRTPAAALTGLSSDEDEARVLRAGFQYYVRKPVDARTLVDVVARLAAENVRKPFGPDETSEIDAARRSSSCRSPGEAMTTSDLLAELRGTQTDMARLVEAGAQAERAYVVVPAQAVTAWMQREPDAWAKVVEWFDVNGKAIVQV
ncbi:MAG TPA: response regulator [Methylomirabilota bacterium]|nr:response regulator [Methylomirabilota bacterium]